MNAFQIVSIPLALFLCLRSVLRFIRGHPHKGTALLAAAVWLAAAVAIYDPDVTVRIARAIGIGRGADLLLYVLALSFLFSIFYVYHRILRLESSLTEIVRKLALMDASHRLSPAAPAPPPDDPGSGRNKGPRGFEPAP